MATQLARSGIGEATLRGYSSYVRPSSNLPCFAFLTPPHCLKKNENREHLPCSPTEITHPSRIGRAPGPLSPPTIAQLMPDRLNAPRSSSSGSIDKKRTLAGAFCRSRIRGKPYF